MLGNIALERGESEDADNLIKSIPAVRQLLYLRTTDLEEQRSEFFDQDLAETLPDAMKYLNAYAVVVHTDSLSSVQKNAVANLFTTVPAFSRQSFGDVDVYTLNHSEASSDGVFVIRDEGWEDVGYDPKRESVFAEVPTEATVTIMNINSYPVTVTLAYTMAPESMGELQAEKNITVDPGQREVKFRHVGNGKSIIQNPSFTVIPFDATQGKSADL